jgi:hypothetical protein
MLKKELFFPVFAAILGIVFILICIAVWLNKGKNPALLRRKLRIGALILSLTAVASCSSPQVSCYELPPVKDTNKTDVVDTIKKDTIPKKVKKDTLLKKVKKDTIKTGQQKPKDTGWQDIRKTCYMPVRKDK